MTSGSANATLCFVASFLMLLAAAGAAATAPALTSISGCTDSGNATFTVDNLIGCSLGRGQAAPLNQCLPGSSALFLRGSWLVLPMDVVVDGSLCIPSAVSDTYAGSWGVRLPPIMP
jgi:hypothetical protein